MAKCPRSVPAQVMELLLSAIVCLLDRPPLTLTPLLDDLEKPAENYST